MRKDYYKPQQYHFKPPIENDSFREPASFLWKHFFQDYFQGHRGFMEILKEVFRVYFPEFSLLSCFPLTISYWLTSITTNVDFCKINKVLCSRVFHIFQNIPLKCSSLYTRLQIILKIYIEKLFNKISFERRGIFEIVITNRYRY